MMGRREEDQKDEEGRHIELRGEQGDGEIPKAETTKLQEGRMIWHVYFCSRLG